MLDHFFLQDVKMEFSFDNGNQTTNSSLASSRLKKAIERNRARQAKREERSMSSAPVPPSKPMGLAARLRATTAGAKTSTPSAATATPTTRTSRGVRPLGSLPGSTMNTAATSSSPTVRKSIARADDFEFAGQIAPRANTSLRSAGSNYSSPPTTARRKVKARTRTVKKEVSYLDYFIRGCWLFAGFLLLRLIFAGGGILDYYYANETLKEKKDEQPWSKAKRNHFRL